MSLIPRMGGGSAQSDVPHCFGNPKYYNENDRDCRECLVRMRCRVRSRNAERLNAIPNPPSRVQVGKKIEQRGSSPADDSEFRIRKKREGSWWSALRRNGFLRVTNTFLKEAAYGVEQIPLDPYTDEELEGKD